MSDATTTADGETDADELSDAELAQLLAECPTRLTSWGLKIEVQPKHVPDTPETCPACGECYGRRQLGVDDRGTHIARYYHGASTPLHPVYCEWPCEWSAREEIAVDPARAERVWDARRAAAADGGGSA